MSILLEALKKSEERRQLGKTPDIHDASHEVAGNERASAKTWLPVVLVSVALAAISWFVWLQYEAPAQVAVSESPEVAQRQESGTDTVPAAGESVKEARTPVDNFTAPQEKTAVPAGGQADASEERKQELARNFSQFRQAEPAVEETEQPPVEKQAAPVPPPAAKKPIPSPEAKPASQPAAPRETEPVSYWELPQNVRDGMPEFRISVMVYAENPADRFMLVNGRRLVEKDTVDGVELLEIRRDGAIFRFRNYRFLVRD